jgi:SAM-dependent methyltransferase
MRCPRCLKNIQESVNQCQCGFSFNHVSSGELQNWFTEVQQALETAYTSASTPWQQSGKSGTFEDWVYLRLANLSPVNNSGTYLDIGCANGYLLECLLAWAKLKGVEILPYGLDFSVRFINLAKKRLANYASNFYIGNVWDWRPPQKFDYVRTELDYVPYNYRKALIERLLTEFVAGNGKLIISQYRSRHDDLTQGWINRDLAVWGFELGC